MDIQANVATLGLLGMVVLGLVRPFPVWPPLA